MDKEISKSLDQAEEGRHPPVFLWYMVSGLHSETGCTGRKVYAGKVFE